MIDSLLATLRRTQDFSSEEDTLEFSRTVDALAELHDPETIPILLPFLADDSEFPEVLYSIIHAVEQFSDDIYVPRLLAVIGTLWASSPEWTKVLHYRIMNHPQYILVYKEVIGRLPERDKYVVNEILTAIRESKPIFAERCDLLLRALR